MSRFEARIRAAVLVVTTVAAWTMLIGQALQAPPPAWAAISETRLADARPVAIALGEACPAR